MTNIDGKFDGNNFDYLPWFVKRRLRRQLLRKETNTATFNSGHIEAL